MTQPRDDDFEEVPGSADLPDDVRNGELADPDEDDPSAIDAAPAIEEV